jgi:hypothetical protein
LREGAREVDQVTQLRRKHPGVKRQAERGKGREPIAEGLIEQQPLWSACRKGLQDRIVAPRRAVADAAVGDGNVALQQPVARFSFSEPIAASSSAVKGSLGPISS